MTCLNANVCRTGNSYINQAMTIAFPCFRFSMFFLSHFYILHYSPPKNKFNDAMIQVEVGIREASQFYRGISSSDAKSMIQKACNAKSYSIARIMFGHFIYNNVKGLIYL